MGSVFVEQSLDVLIRAEIDRVRALRAEAMLSANMVVSVGVAEILLHASRLLHAAADAVELSSE